MPVVEVKSVVTPAAEKRPKIIRPGSPISRPEVLLLNIGWVNVGLSSLGGSRPSDPSGLGGLPPPPTHPLAQPGGWDKEWATGSPPNPGGLGGGSPPREPNPTLI